tara:strand:+ start:83 stop:592 length:510 start_codon:yes stop_codon:yes gene_type:complete
MEKRINSKTRAYLQQFKNDIKQEIMKYNIESKSIQNILQFMYDYQPLEFNKTDFQKRKRVKNIVPFHERCCALRANNEQCTRRKKDKEKFCGTHIKGTPHGEINKIQQKKTHQVKTVWAEDIKGIIYYIDNENNVYCPQDIMNNVIDPRIIAKYIFENNKYSIPSLFNK